MAQNPSDLKIYGYYIQLLEIISKCGGIIAKWMVWKVSILPKKLYHIKRNSFNGIKTFLVNLIQTKIKSSLKFQGSIRFLLMAPMRICVLKDLLAALESILQNKEIF